MHIKVCSYRRVYPHIHAHLVYFLRIGLLVPHRASPGVLCSWPNYSCRPRGSPFFWGWFACVSQGTDWQNWGKEKASSEVMINKARQLLLPDGELETRPETSYLEGQVGLRTGAVELAWKPSLWDQEDGKSVQVSGTWGLLLDIQLVSSMGFMFPFPQVMKDPSRQDADFYPESFTVPEKHLTYFIQLFSVNSGKLGQGNLHFNPKSKPFNTGYVILFLNLPLFLRPIYPPLLYLPCHSPCPLPPKQAATQPGGPASLEPSSSMTCGFQHPSSPSGWLIPTPIPFVIMGFLVPLVFMLPCSPL